MAEGQFAALVRGRSDYRVGSAGISAAPGQPASRHTADLLKREDIDLSGFRSRQLTGELVDQATHIFVMTGGHRQFVEMLFPEAASKTYLLCEFCADDDLRGRDVPDPIGMGREAYEETLRIMKRALPSVLAYIEKTWKPDKPSGASYQSPPDPPT